jgi:hypothetical protein
MLLHVLLYALEWLGFTINHVSQSNRNTHVQVIYSCCNLPVHTILQMKPSLQLVFIFQVTHPQRNIYDECGQHTVTPRTSQQTVQCSPSRMSHLKELPCLRHVRTITLPTSTNNPTRSLSHRIIICKPPRCMFPHPMSHTKGERTPLKSLGLRSSNSG